MKPGDRVICIDCFKSNGVEIPRLQIGKEYTVEKVGNQYIYLVDVIGGWYPKRFEIKKWNGVRKPYIPKAYKTYLSLGGTKTYVEFALLLKAQKKRHLNRWVEGTYRMIRIGEED